MPNRVTFDGLPGNRRGRIVWGLAIPPRATGAPSMAVADYYDRVNPDLLRVIPPDARTVLEVGCGTGAMADHYRRINPKGRYVGVEMNPEAAELARGRLDRVVVGDVAVLSDEEIGLAHGSCDVLVFGDVLEHMIDPWGVLKRLARLVRDGGQVVACIPNVQHWTVILELLRGRFEYQAEGLMDRTHMRFFAAEGLTPLFEGAGLSIFDVQPRAWPSADADAFERAMAPVVQALGLDPVAFGLRTRALQYVVRAAKAATPARRMAIQTLIAEPLVCARVRVLEPDIFLGTIPGVRTVAATDPNHLGATLPGEETVFIRQRNVILEGESLIGHASLVKSGMLVVAEFDDDPEHFPVVAENRHLTFSACHAVQTSTEALADAIRPFNPNVRVFANQVALLPPLRPPREGGPLTLFFGALNRESDWADLVAPLNRVLADRGDSVRIRIVHDWAFYDALETEGKEYEKFCAYDRYVEILRSADVAILPLNPTRFNLCKSDLKFIECAAHGVAAMASPTVYGETIRDGETGLLFRSPDEFEAGLNRLLDDAALRRSIVEEAHRYVADERMLSAHFRERYEWYRELRDRLPELTRQLRERVPEMFG